MPYPTETDPLPPSLLSHHAMVRAQQRGVRPAVVDLLLARFDVERPIGSGCHAVSCSRSALDRARRDGLAASMAERLAGLVLIVAPDGSVITVLNRETWFARFQRGHARLGTRERARMAARRQRGGGAR